MPGIVDVTIQLDQTLKTNAEGLFEKLGMTFSTATAILLEQAVQKGAIPCSSIEDDSFWGKKNQVRLKDSLQELIDGKIVVKTSKELEAMENE